MLCSVPTAKSSSNWLDRLRSSKGFPAADNFDLDHFLTNHDDPSPSPIPSYSIIYSNSESDDKLLSADRSPAAETSTGNGDREWYGVMTNVLCDLFNMGEESSEKISRRSARKQTNPKFWEVSGNEMECTRKEEYVSDKNSNAECGGDEEEEEEKEKSSDSSDKEKEEEEEELKGYSRSEVTVIDTSFEVWKLDKLVFRRKNIWKVVDKEGKSWTAGGTKKRKGTHLDSTIRNVAYKNKSKSTNSIVSGSLNDGMKQQDQKQEEACKNSLDGNFHVPKKRIDLCRSPKKSKKNSSSVVLIKAIASSKKSRKNLLPHNSQFKENSSKRMRLD